MLSKAWKAEGPPTDSRAAYGNDDIELPKLDSGPTSGILDLCAPPLGTARTVRAGQLTKLVGDINAHDPVGETR